MMQKAAFGTSSEYSRWPSRSAHFAFPYITTNGTNSPWAAGHLPLAYDIAATCSPGTAAMESFPFRGHFTLAKAALPDHPQSLMSGLVSLLRLIPYSMSSVSSSHTKAPNQSLQLTAGRSDI